MRYRGYVSAVLAGSGALQATGQAATVQQEPQRLAVVIPAYDFGRVMFLGQWRSPCLYATQQNMDLVLLSGGEHEDAATAVDIAESAGPCFSNTVQAHIQNDMYRREHSVALKTLLLDEDFRSDFSEYDAIAIVEWDVLAETNTPLDEVYRAAFSINTRSAATHGIAVHNNTGSTSVHYSNLTCSGKHYPCGVVARSLSQSVSSLLSEHQPPKAWVTTGDACADFATGVYPGLSWTFDDCMKVWETFAMSAPQGMQRRFPSADLWKDTAVELRRAGSPCLVAPPPIGDGVGSSTIRHLATWIYSEQMGCDWVTPVWGRGFKLGNGAVVYCHSMKFEHFKTEEEKQSMNHCSVANWLSYFQFDVPSVALPQNETIKHVQPEYHSTDGILAIQQELLKTGFSNSPWDRIVFTFHPSHASSALMNLGSWDEPKRQIVRNVLQEARENFHRHPRPWYDEDPKCAFTKDRLHFAMHVRMGDRQAFQGASNRYFELLEDIMGIISAEVVHKGLPEPLFHVFSETVVPCPSLESGVFDEFPTWLVGINQVRACLAAPIPDDCPQKQAGGYAVSVCKPTRDGIFNVLSKNIILHVGEDVQNAMSCMIQADGLLMGCSTFGQVAGILSKGISMFSMKCVGPKTPHQYATTPPLAVAERGHLWVPIEGSWRDPILSSVSSFRGALDALLSQKGTSV